MTAVLGLGLMGPALSSNAATSNDEPPPVDWVSVDKVMVNKLGGVNVSGQVSCAGAYAQLSDLEGGGLWYDTGQKDDDGNPIFGLIPKPGIDDSVVLQANNDNYTVSQPAGRRTMIQVTHGSSRMSPCFVLIPEGNPEGSVFGSNCGAEGETPCQ